MWVKYEGSNIKGGKVRVFCRLIDVAFNEYIIFIEHHMKVENSSLC